MESFRASRGFTLVEMLVVLAIIGIITSIAVTGQGAFNKSFILSNAAYDIALTLRSAEAYGLSNRGSAGLINVGYGLHFEREEDNSFIFFADNFPSPDPGNCHGVPSEDADAPDARPGNCFYDAGQDTIMSNYTLGNGITISDFCVLPAGGGSRKWDCANDGRGNGNSYGNRLTSLDVVFARPNTQAFVSTNDDPNDDPDSISAVCLIISSASGGEPRYIHISVPSGAITANASPCPP